MWLIIPLIYFLAWWQTGSLRQAFNGTIAWIIGYGISAFTILMLDFGGYAGISATPESPAAGVAILGGFVGMWISNILWRRRGGDPERTPGKWERAARAMIGQDKKSGKKKKKRAPRPQGQVAPPQQQPQQPAAVDAQYRAVPGQPQPAQGYQAAQTQPAGQSGPTPPVHQGPVNQRPAPTAPKEEPRRSETADKYAKATGRALGAMFHSSGTTKKKSGKKTQK